MRRSLSWDKGTGGLLDPFSMRPSFEGHQGSGPVLQVRKTQGKNSWDQRARSSQPSLTASSSRKPSQLPRGVGPPLSAKPLAVLSQRLSCTS